MQELEIDDGEYEIDDIVGAPVLIRNERDAWSNSNSRKDLIPQGPQKDVMTRHWLEDKGRILDQNTPMARQLNQITAELNGWYRQRKGQRNPWDAMENVIPDGGVKMRMLFRGLQTKSLTPGMLFTMHYTAYVEPEFGQPIDATRFGNRCEVFKYSESEVLVYGIMLALARMNLGDSVHLRIEPQYAYGEHGCPPRIPKNAVIHYILELRDEQVPDRKCSAKFLRQPEDIKADLGFTVCFRAAKELREKGVEFYKKEAYELARENFSEALKAILICEDLLGIPSDEVQTEADGAFRQLMDIRRNLMITHVKLFEWKQVKKMAQAILNNDPNNAKGMYYLALAYKNLGKSEDAIEKIRCGLQRHPHCPEIAELYHELKKQEDKDLVKEKLMCLRMFQSARPKKALDKWELVGPDVRQHVADQIGNMLKNPNMSEIPMKFTYFTDKTNLAYFKEEVAKAGLAASVKQGVNRLRVSIHRLPKT